MSKSCTLLLSVFVSISLIAQEGDSYMVQSDTISVVKKTQLIGVPIAFYTPETSFGIGGGIQFMFNDMPDIFYSRLSDMMVTAVYTSKNQLLLDARPKIHLFDGHFFLDGLFRYKLFPNSFWGIGNRTQDGDLENYNMKSTEITATLLKRIPNTVNFGFEYSYERYTMLEYDSLGQLKDLAIDGSAGALISSFSAIFLLDDRDNIYSTKKGNYFKLQAGFSGVAMGATHSFNKYLFDYRKYIPLGSKLSLATQCYVELTVGEVPFQKMPWLGGGERTRGYFRGRFIDNNFYAVQSELRWNFAPRWILAGFISGGEVGGSVESMIQDIKYSYGGGVRFKLSKKSPVFVRLDVGIGKPGNSGVYFGVNEAF